MFILISFFAVFLLLFLLLEVSGVINNKSTPQTETKQSLLIR